MQLLAEELDQIYAEESCFDDPDIREAKLVLLCGESKSVFVEKLDPCRAGAYIIKNEGGVYKTRAVLKE